MEDKALLTLKELCEYLCIGQTKARELLSENNWSLKIGNRWYAHKKKLDEWLELQTTQI